MIPQSGQSLYSPDPVHPPAAPQDIYRPRRSFGWVKLVAAFLATAALVGAGAATGLARYGGAYARTDFRTVATALDAAKGDPNERARRVSARIAALAPGPNEVYVVIDSFNNRLRVFKGSKQLREAVVSTGSGVLLRDPRNGKQWLFDTPTGELKILNKTAHPIWIKPDWAFIEDGYEPPKNMRERMDDFSLGDYALYMRDGYIIHGTIFKTLLGKRVTHGCVRLGDEDLKFVYDTVPVGSRVFLY